MKQQQVQIAAAPVMIQGLKADFHQQQHAIKVAKCPFDAGFDLYPASTVPHVARLANGLLFTIDTFLHCVFPIGTFGFICERSSSLVKLGAARIKPGIIDSGYTGEIKIQVVSLNETFDATMELIKQAQDGSLAIAQMLVMPVMRPVFAVWDEKKVPPGRGNAGFGSTDRPITFEN